MNEYTSGDLYGYVRVSARDQNEDRQLIALENFEIPKEMCIRDRCGHRILLGSKARISDKQEKDILQEVLENEVIEPGLWEHK